MVRHLRHNVWTCFVVALAVVFGASSAAAASPAPFSPGELVDSRERLDGRSVALVGEAIGEALNADADHVWINISTDSVGVGVYMDRALARRVRVFGDYNHTGDRVIARGTFNLACPQHAGELDVHASDVYVVERGSRRIHYPKLWKAAVGVAGLAFFAVCGRTLYRRRRGLAG